MPDLAPLNGLSDADSRTALLRCCGASRWADQMAARRPFANESELLAVATAIWRSLERADWLEAFAAHPKIGDLDTLRSKFAHTAEWSAQEQGGMSAAAEATIQALAAGNRTYEMKFGHIFIVFATGKSAAEMLLLLNDRLKNDKPTELRAAAEEQRKITALRLEKMVLR